MHGDLGLADKIENIDEKEEESDDDDEANEDVQLMNMYADIVLDDNMDKSTRIQERLDHKKEESEQDIFLRYGTGIVNYFNLYEKLIRLFCFLSVLALPQIVIYNYFNGYDYTK